MKVAHLFFFLFLFLGCATQKRIVEIEKEQILQKQLLDQEQRIFYLQKKLNGLELDLILLQQDLQDSIDMIMDFCSENEGC